MRYSELKRRRRFNRGPQRGSHAGVVNLPAHSKNVVLRVLLLYPLRNHSLQLIRLIVKEVSRAFDDAQVHRRVDLCNQLAQTIEVAVFIVLAMNKQHRFAATGEKAEIILIDGSPDTDHSDDPLVGKSDLQTYARAE